jgi:DNA polymerase
MSARDDIAAHLRVFADMGVNGISRDRAWRERTEEVRSAKHEVRKTSDEAQSVEEDAAAIARTPEGSVNFESRTSNVELGTSEAPSPEPSAFAKATADRQVPSPTPQAESLSALQTHIGPCTRCPLHAMGRTQVVFGAGNPNAKLMFVGEAPGGDEDRQGEPFVGAAGQLLTKIIEAIELKRSDVYIANVIKCRPPGNRNPEPVEVATCKPFLLQQIDIIRPKVIVALGTFAAQTLLETDTPISRLRGRVQALRGGISLVPTFHPAFLLRSPDRKRDVWEDMKKVRALLAESD